MSASPSDTSTTESRLRRRLRVPLIALGVLILVGAGSVAAMPDAEPKGTLLGASGSVSGGIARINGVIPLEVDGWLPEKPPAVLRASAREGTHRVRIILELTALDARGLDYSLDDFAIDGLGSDESRLLWSDPKSATVAQGAVVTVTQVFEIPNKAIELTLRANNGRFVLGTSHHTG
jgi:hypothetical protein